jgi:plasmid stabilization system protein ParE
MALEIRWTPQAIESLDKIAKYLSENWSSVVCQKFMAKTKAQIKLLSIFPRLGKVQNADKDIRALLLVKQVSLFYRIENNTIILIDFFDNRRKPI